MTWVYAVLKKPQNTRPKIRFLGCSGCQVKRKGNAACLAIPKAKARVKLSVIVEGYQPCLHSLSSTAGRLTWQLQEDDPSGLAVSNYRCAWPGR